MIFTRHLSEAQLNSIEQVYEAKLTHELRSFLKDNPSVKAAKKLSWKNPHKIKEAQQILFEHMLAFDLEHNDNYWPIVFGERPLELQDRIEKAIKYIQTLPPLIPVGSLKYYAPTSIDDASKPLPVISFHQFVDTIFRSKDLESYREGLWITSDEREHLPGIVGWSEVFDGLGANKEMLYCEMENGESNSKAKR